jgi:hypothetical protein
MFVATFFAILFHSMFLSNALTMPTSMESQTRSNYILARKSEFYRIPAERRELLSQLSLAISKRLQSKQKVKLVFICTHNSRRSHLSQIWASIAASEYHVDDIQTYSGGTEATAFNPRAIAALQRAGVEIQKTTNDDNPVYDVHVVPGNDQSKLQCFSKRYDESPNPTSDFMAVMTCTQADKGCPLVRGADFRIAIPYEDPKASDGTPNEAKRYDECCELIAREMLYLFSMVQG